MQIYFILPLQIFKGDMTALTIRGVAAACPFQIEFAEINSLDALRYEVSLVACFIVGAHHALEEVSA